MLRCHRPNVHSKVHRLQSVKIDHCTFNPLQISHGVPQGAVLGPVLFTMYASPVEDIALYHKLNCTIYAEDSQLYVMMNPLHRSRVLERLRYCVNQVIGWTTINKLQFNREKTQIIPILSRFIRNPSMSNLNIGNTLIKQSEQVRDLGDIFDQKLNLRSHINSICRSSSLAVRNIPRVC